MDKEIRKVLAFVKACEVLKNEHRAARTSKGKKESIAEHSWRLTVLVMLFQKEYSQELNLEKMLAMSLIHDLGEALQGDIPAPKKQFLPNADQYEDRDFKEMVSLLPNSSQTALLKLWEEYNGQESKEAQLVKALDRIESALQHNEGVNPKDFDYDFALQYGLKECSINPSTMALRSLIAAETKEIIMKNSRPKRWFPVKYIINTPIYRLQSVQIALRLGLSVTSLFSFIN